MNLSFMLLAQDPEAEGEMTRSNHAVKRMYTTQKRTPGVALEGSTRGTCVLRDAKGTLYKD
jgi:hypothetical protein